MSVSSSSLMRVVVPSEQVQEILEHPIVGDVEQKVSDLSLLRGYQGYSLPQKTLLASYLTGGINQQGSAQESIGLCYEVARKVFGDLNPQVGRDIHFEAKHQEVSIFSDQPVKHAVILDKEELLYYLLNKENLEFEEIQEPLTEYICGHTAENSASMLRALYEKNPKLLIEFLETQVSLLKECLTKSKETSENTIDQFLSLIKFNKAYQMFYGQMAAAPSSAKLAFPVEEAKYVMEIAHFIPVGIMKSQTIRVKKYSHEISELTPKSKDRLLELQSELTVFIERVQIAKNFLREHSALEEGVKCSEDLKGKAESLFEMDTAEYKTHLRFVIELRDQVEAKLKIPSRPKRELEEADLHPPAKAKRVVKASSKSTCTIF
jgi:hypothetical protein